MQQRKPNEMRKVSRLFICLASSLMIFTSCQNIDDYRRERVVKADKAFQKIKDKKFPTNAVLSLPYCIELALKNNLDLKVYQLKEAVDGERKTAAALGMLPDLMITNDVAQRSNQPGAKSVSLSGATAGTTSLNYSKSTDPFENRVRAELMFSAIDFGLAFCNYIQQDDRAMLTTEQKRRAAQNLILDVTRSYLRVAAAQYAMEETERMISLSIETEELLRNMAKNKTVPLVSVLEENKKFIVLQKSLMEYRRSYQNSCIELRSLMGFYPTSEVKVDTSAMNQLVKLNIPDIELLEEASLIERPELFQLDIQKHITLIEARKTIITMFPNVQIFLDFTNSTNPFLYHYSWWEVGARAAYNLLKLPQKIEHYYALDAEEEQIKAQALALSVGILAQVRIAHANLIEVKERYELAENLYEVYEKHEAIAEIKSKSAGSLSKIELSRIKIESAQKAIERTQALGNYYLSYFRLLNAVGLRSFDKTELEELKKRIEASINEVIKDELANAANYQVEIDDIQNGIDIYNKKIAALMDKIDNDKQVLLSKESELDSHSITSENILQSIRDDYDQRISILNSSINHENNNIEQLKSQLTGEQLHLKIIPEDEHSIQAVADVNSRIDGINNRIESSKNKIEIANDRIDDINSELQDALKKSQKIVGSRFVELKDSTKDISKNIVNNMVNAVEYQAKVERLESEKGEFVTKLNESEMVKNDHYKRLKKYSDAIEQCTRIEENSDKKENTLLKYYDSIIKIDGNEALVSEKPVILPHGVEPKVGEETLDGQAVRSVSNLNMEMQQQSGERGNNNTISVEEFTPGKAGSIVVEAQEDAANDNIDQEAFNPMTQNDITVQTMKDANNNQIYGSGYDQNEMNQENRLDNQMQRQMNRSMDQPGRSGN